MDDTRRSALRNGLRFISLVVLSLVSLVGSAMEASSLEGIPRLAAAGAGFAAYLFLFARALGRLPVDWNGWRDRSLEGFRSAGRSQAV